MGVGDGKRGPGVGLGSFWNGSCELSLLEVSSIAEALETPRCPVDVRSSPDAQAPTWPQDTCLASTTSTKGGLAFQNPKPGSLQFVFRASGAGSHGLSPRSDAGLLLHYSLSSPASVPQVGQPGGLWACPSLSVFLPKFCQYFPIPWIPTFKMMRYNPTDLCDLNSGLSVGRSPQTDRAASNCPWIMWLPGSYLSGAANYFRNRIQTPART